MNRKGNCIIRAFKLSYSIALSMLLHSTYSYTQSGVKSEGDVYISEGVEVSIHTIPLTMVNMSSGSLPGIIGTDRIGNKGYLSFAVKGLVNGGSDAAHVDGYVKSYLPTTFVFPIGDNGVYRPCQVSSASFTQPTSAAYYRANPSVAVKTSLKEAKEPRLLNGTTYNTIATDVDVKNVSAIEYWDINGQSASQISLTWNAASDVAAMTGGHLSKLTIVGWTGAKWVVIPSRVDATSILGGLSTLQSGSISTTSAITPDAYDVYTIAIISYPLSDTVTVARKGSPFPVLDTVLNNTITSPSVIVDSTRRTLNEGTIGYTPIVMKDTIVFVAENTEAMVAMPIHAIPRSSTVITLNRPSHGTAMKNEDGTVVYTPKTGFVGIDSVARIICVTVANNRTICDTSWIIYHVGKIDLTSIPNYFSPNGDGLNDVWNLDGLLSIYPNAKVMIYDRWGKIVWKSKGSYAKSISTTNVWYGQVEGSQSSVPDGVYYYLIELEDNLKNNKTGFVELMRQ